MIISPHMLKLADKSKELFVEKYIDKIPEIQLSAPFKKGKEIHALANYFLSGQDISKLEKALDERNSKTWQTLKNNQYFKMEIFASEHSVSTKLGEFWIGGRIDAIVKNNENYYILDYKTGQIPENARYDYQTMVYLYCMDKKLKNYKSLNFVYLGLKDNFEEKITLTKELKKEYEQRLSKACTKIKTLM